HGNRRRRKAQADKKERTAQRDRVLDGKKGSAPEHGDQNEKGFLRFDGECETGERHAAPANKHQSSSVRCLWLQFNVAEIKKPPGDPGGRVSARRITYCCHGCFCPLFCQLLM